MTPWCCGWARGRAARRVGAQREERTQDLPRLLLDVHLLSFVENEVHILVEPLSGDKGGGRARWHGGSEGMRLGCGMGERRRRRRGRAVRVLPRTMMRPSTLVSVFSKSQTCILCLLCRNLKIRFCGAGTGPRFSMGERKAGQQGRSGGGSDAQSAGS